MQLPEITKEKFINLIDSKERMPMPGQLVKLKHTIISEAIWDGEQFVLKDCKVTCDARSILKNSNHTLAWKIYDEEVNTPSAKAEGFSLSKLSPKQGTTC